MAKSKALALATSKVVALDELRGWDKLSRAEQEKVQANDLELGSLFGQVGKGWLAIGRLMKAQRDILEPHGLFDLYLKGRPFGLSRSTAYRRIGNYDKVAKIPKDILPPEVLTAALANGLDKINIETIKVVRPPKTIEGKIESREVAKYLRQVTHHDRRKKRAADEAAVDPEVMKKEIVNFWRSRYEKLPEEWNSRKRAEWQKSICGMAMTILGVSSDQTISPIAIPIDWNKRRSA